MTNHSKQFLKYVIPSIISFVLSGLYCFVDAYFVGNNVGDSGIAAINIAFSLLSVTVAIGFGLGTGASVLYSIKQDERYIRTSYALMTILSVLVTIPMVLFPKKLMELLGATEFIAQTGESYMRILASFSALQIFSCGIGPILRNYGAPNAAMASMVSGLVSNIILDWLFVSRLQFGMNGAAWASVIAQAIDLAIGLILMPPRKKNPKARMEKTFLPATKEILKIAMSPIGLTIIPNVSIIIVNRCCLKYGGDQALGAFGCISYLTYIIGLVVQGIDDGAQPLASRYFGLNDTDGLGKTNKLTMVWALCFSLATAAISSLTGYSYGIFMGASAQVSGIIQKAMMIFAIGIPFAAVNRTMASIFYACADNVKSYLLSYSEPLFIFILSLFLPEKMGLDGIWLSNVGGQICVFMLAMISSHHS